MPGSWSGLTDVSPGRGFELRPYLAGHAAEAPGRVSELGNDDDVDVGLDMAYNLTPSLRGVATINTDFAETEVDQRLVNLTRFPLFLPERRTFFLDGATYFDFPFDSFFSRRIGLIEGQPQPIVGGGKLTGQAGKNDIGALYVRTNEEEIVPGESFLVGRWRRRMLQQSYFGAFYTGRDTHADLAGPTRHTAGADFRLATATFLGNKNLAVSGYWVANSTGHGIGDSAAYSGRAEYLNDIWEATSQYQEVQEEYDPAVGFTPRRAYRYYNQELIWSPRPKTRHRYIRRFRFGLDPDLYTDLRNVKQSIDLDLMPFRIELHSGDNAEVGISPTYERLDEPFEIADGVILPGGTDYDFVRYNVAFNTANQRVVALHPEIEWGSFYSGDRTRYTLGVDIRPRAGLRLNTVYEYNRVDAARRQLQHHARPRGRRHAVQPVHVPGQQRPVRLGERRARLAGALPLDRPPGQRRVHRLHPQLGGGSVRPQRSLPDPGPAGGGQGGLHASGSDPAPSKLVLLSAFCASVTAGEVAAAPGIWASSVKRCRAGGGVARLGGGAGQALHRRGALRRAEQRLFERRRRFLVASRFGQQLAVELEGRLDWFGRARGRSHPGLDLGRFLGQRQRRLLLSLRPGDDRAELLLADAVRPHRVGVLAALRRFADRPSAAPAAASAVARSFSFAALTPTM